MTSQAMNPDTPLAGMRVVVTRPAQQAQALCALIERAGGRAELFPVLEIAPPADARPAEAVIERLGSYDIAVFVSRNAVHRGMALVAERGRDLRGLLVLAVGSGTAAALHAQGIGDVLCPQGDERSEGLLGLGVLTEPAVRGKRVVIFRGEGGRALLGDVLSARGAEVDYAEVYRRVCPAVVNTPWDHGRPDVAVVTSGEGLRNLFAMMSETARGRLLETPLVVVGERLAALAHELGVRAAPVVASGASDAALVAALVDWRSQGPGRTCVRTGKQA